MPATKDTDSASRWVGGFEASNPAFAYPNPDLSSLDMLGNLDNINLLDRQQDVLWPQFSWETDPGAADPRRCYQMFAPDISRIGYTSEGRVYSIICPQQGACVSSIGCMNVEVTVTGQRGWVDEDTKTMAADMSVVGKIWFSPSAKQNFLVRLLWKHFADSGLPFPSSKEDAIVVKTCLPGHPDQKVFPLRSGETSSFPIPEFARHKAVAWDVANLQVEIREIVPSGNDEVDRFNQLVLDVFNVGSGNMLKCGNILTWDVWFTPPGPVNRTEWCQHAEKWRTSIDADHGSPDGPGTDAQYFDGTKFEPGKALLEEEEQKFYAYLKDHFT